MADYIGRLRTNYFSVTDAEKFKKIMAQCKAQDTIEVFDEKQEDGSVKYGFLCDGSIHGLPDTDNEPGENEDECDEEDYDYNYDAFCEALQEILPDDDAIFITEVGYEKMRYLVGECTIITSSGFKVMTLKNEARSLARIMLNNPEYTTKMEY